MKLVTASIVGQHDCAPHQTDTPPSRLMFPSGGTRSPCGRSGGWGEGMAEVEALFLGRKGREGEAVWLLVHRWGGHAWVGGSSGSGMVEAWQSTPQTV